MNSIKYSLIVATLGRSSDVAVLLESLAAQTIAAEAFEVIIVDQNQEDLLSGIVSQYASRLNLVHIRSSVKGLSYNRNLGILQSRGTYVCVPDDDCTYYPDTLAAVDRGLEQFGGPDMIIGKVFDRQSQKYIFKRTPASACVLNRWNFYKYVSSITLFFKKEGHSFDEQFGIGAPFPSNEDGALILEFLEQGLQVVYSPAIECNHPPYDGSNMSRQKLVQYGIGFGAMCRKYLSVPLLWLFFKVIGFQLLMVIKHVFLLDKEQVLRRADALKGRVSGFFTYRKHSALLHRSEHVPGSSRQN